MVNKMTVSSMRESGHHSAAPPLPLAGVSIAMERVLVCQQNDRPRRRQGAELGRGGGRPVPLDALLPRPPRGAPIARRPSPPPSPPPLSSSLPLASATAVATATATATAIAALHPSLRSCTIFTSCSPHALRPGLFLRRGRRSIDDTLKASSLLLRGRHALTARSPRSSAYPRLQVSAAPANNDAARQGPSDPGGCLQQ